MILIGKIKNAESCNLFQINHYRRIKNDVKPKSSQR